MAPSGRLIDRRPDRGRDVGRSHDPEVATEVEY